MPGRVYELMPIAVLIGTLYALDDLAWAFRRITVLRASGLSTSALPAWPAVDGSTGGDHLRMGEALPRPAERAAQQWRLAATPLDGPQREPRTGLWVRDGRRFVQRAQRAAGHHAAVRLKN